MKWKINECINKHMHGWISKTTNLCSEKLLFGWSIKHMSGLKNFFKGYQNVSFYPLTMTIILIRLGRIQWWKYGTQRGRKPFKNDRGLQNRQFPFFQEMSSTLICLHPWEKKRSEKSINVSACFVPVFADITRRLSDNIIPDYTPQQSLINICFHEIFSANVLFER